MLRFMNIVLLVGRISDRPFRPGNAERLVVRVDVPSPRRAGHIDEIEFHCFGTVATHVEAHVKLGDTVEVRGRVEHRIGHDEHGEYDDIRIVGDDVVVLRSVAHRGTGDEASVRLPSCDGTQCVDLEFVEGVVKGFRANQNYGFIATPNIEGDVFFLARDIHGTAVPKQGDTVRFVLQTRQKGHGAAHISLVESE
jgi:cold shock CspA family protein/single-stranded DNA-binding protein